MGKDKKTKDVDISEVEKSVDKIISKNKDAKQDNLSKVIITQARDNLGEKPLENEYETETPKPQINEEKPKDKKRKIKIKIGKKNKTRENKDDLHTTEDILESDDFNNIIYENERKSSLEYKQDEELKFLDEKINDEKQKYLEDEILSNMEKSASSSEKERGFLSKKSEDDSAKTQKKTYDEKTGPDDYKEGQKFDAKPQKKSFFKKKNNTNKQTNKVNDYQIKKETPEATAVFKPRFKVENIPNLSRDETDIIDENIKKNADNISIVNVSQNQKTDIDKAEEKAHKLFEEHLKDLNMKKAEKQDAENVEEKKDISFEGLDSKNKYLFFDEDISDSDGWSPHLTDKERKELKGLTGEKTDNIPIGEINDIELPKDVLSVKSVKLSDLGFSENEWEELDFYALNEPYAYVEILREKESLEKCYFLVEIELNEEEENNLNFIKETLSSTSIKAEEIENAGDDTYLASCVQNIIKEYDLKISNESLSRILYYLTKTSLGLSKIDPIMIDPNIEDISCDGANVPLFLYHRKFGSLKSNVFFTNEDELSGFIFKLAQKCGKHISLADPILDATMPDGSRIQMTLSDEITARGSTFTIRKFRSDPFSPPDLIEFNTMSSEMLAYMWLAIENGINMLFAGGTASGKTTALNALALFIPPEAKIVSIEETREINLPHSNWIPGVARAGFGQVVSDKMIGQIDMYDLMKAALRQRPEYILVGEIRGREAYVLFQAMATGHATYSTVHADSANSLIHRLEGKPINIPRVMLQSLDVVSLHITTKVKNKRTRRCKQIIEIIDIDPTTKEILTNEVFRWDPVEDTFYFSGKSYVLERIRAEKDMSRDQITEEIKSRKRIIEIMNENNIREFKGVARIISRYLDDPANTLKMMDKGAKEE